MLILHFCDTLIVVELDILPGALKHGVTGEAIVHATTNPLVVDHDFAGKDSPKVLVIGPDAAGNILELLGVFGSDDLFVVFHAMRARRQYLEMLE